MQTKVATERGGTLHNKKDKPKTTTTPTPAMMPVIVGSSVLPEAAFPSCAWTTLKQSSSTKTGEQIWSMQEVGYETRGSNHERQAIGLYNKHQKRSHAVLMCKIFKSDI